MKHLGKVLRELRGNASLREASKRIGISHNYLRNLEKGIDPRTKTPIAPSVDTLKKISKAYGYPYEKLLRVAGYIDDDNKEKSSMPIEYSTIIGKRIALLRKKRGLSQEEFAKKINVSPSTVAMWEVGKREVKSSTLSELAQFFNVSTDYLLGRKNKLYHSKILIFDKKKFAELLEKAKGNRSINHYAQKSGVTSAHISRLLRCLLDSPPTPQTIKKLADHAHNGVTYQDLMEAAGYIAENDTEAKCDIQIELEEIIKELKKEDSSITFRGQALNMLDARDRDLLITCFENFLRLTEQIVYRKNDKRNI